MNNKAANRGQDVMDESDRDRQLAKLKQAQRQKSAREAAVRHMLDTNGNRIEDKVAAVKTLQKTDRPRVISAFSRLLNEDQKPE